MPLISDGGIRLTKDINVKIPNSDYPPIGRSLPLGDNRAVGLPDRHTITLDRCSVRHPQDGQLVKLIGTTVDDQHCLAVIRLPCEYLSRGVEQYRVANRIVGNMDLGVSAVQGQRASKLRDGYGALGGRQGQSVVGRVLRCVIRVSNDEEGSVSSNHWSGDNARVRVVDISRRRVSGGSYKIAR